MDEAGIDMAGLTNHSYTLEEWRKWHDLCAGLVEKYPKRFVGFASVEPLGGEPAFDELERAVKELGMRYVHIHARARIYPDRKGFDGYAERLEEPVNIEPALTRTLKQAEEGRSALLDVIIER